MTEKITPAVQPGPGIPADDLSRQLAVADPAGPATRHIGMVGNTYSILLSGADTNGRYCLIDMHIPPGGGPPPHRHDFEEMFSILDGEIELTFRGRTIAAKAGTTVNVPANAPHSFKNVSDKPARLLCLCSPAGQEDFFMAVADPVESRTSPPPTLSAGALAERRKLAGALAADYRTEMVMP